MYRNIKLAVSYLRYYRKQSVILFFGMCMSVLLLVGISSLLCSNRNADYKNAQEEYGSWDYIIPVSTELEKRVRKGDLICSDDDFYLEQSGFYCSRLCESERRDVTFCYGDDDYFEMTGRTLLEGRYPENKKEIALDYYALHNLDLDYSLGSTLEIGKEKYILTGIISEGAKTDGNSVMVFTDENTVSSMGGDRFFCLKFSGRSRVYGQFSAFLQRNHIHLADYETNDGTAAYTGAEPEESVFDIVRTAMGLKEGRLIYLLGTLENNQNILQKMVFWVIFIFGIFMIYSIFQVIIEKRTGQYGTLEVLGIEERDIFASMLAELVILFFPAYIVGGLSGNVLAGFLCPGEFVMDRAALYRSFLLFVLFLLLLCMAAVRNMRRYTQVEKMRNGPGRLDRRIICRRRHNLLRVLSRRFVLAKWSVFLGIIISLSLGGVLFICTTYVADNAKQNNIHTMLTEESLYTDISVTIDDDDLGNVIPKDIVNSIRESHMEGLKDIFPISYTLGEVPFNNGVFKWKDFYPEVAESPGEAKDQEIMEKYNGIATRQGESDYKLKVNVYGYEEQQLSDLSEYLLEGAIEPDVMSEKNQVVLKTLMDGAGYYDGIDIHPGDRITLKVPRNAAEDGPEVLKFQLSGDHYIEKDFIVAAVVSQCVGETKEFIGSGTNVAGIIMPQQMLESDFGVAGYHSLHINLKEAADSEEVIRELRPYLAGLNKSVIHDNTIDIDKKNELLMQKAYFFYGIAVILFLISLLHTANSMKHQIQSRRYEFGVLRAMGITERGFCGMLIREGIFYGAAVSICMGIITVACKHVLAGIMQHVIRYIIVNSGIPLFPCIAMILSNIVVCVLVMLLSGREMLRKSIVEEISN